MRKASTVLSGLLTLLVLFLAACAPAAPPAPAAPAPAPAPAAVLPAPQPPAKAAWEAKWEKLIEDAKKEGRVVFVSSAGGPVRTALMKALKQNYGLAFEMVTGSGGESIERLQRERRAGIHAVDIFMAGLSPALMAAGEAGVPLEMVFILPDVTDPALIEKLWWKGKLSWVDKAHKALSMMGTHNIPATINTQVVKPEEVKSYQDLLNPKWKGKMILRDPSGIGGGPKWFASSVHFGIVTEDYMRQLAKQDIVITRDARLQIDWVAKGKTPIALAADLTVVQEFRDAGAPVEQVALAKKSYLSAGHSDMVLLRDAPHPNAARLFVNWLLTKEGQTVLARSLGTESRRLDVPTDHLQPIALRQPSYDYGDSDTEEFNAVYDNYRKLAKEIFQIK